MSEAERKRRLDYRKFRQKWVTIQAVVLAAVLIVCALSTAIFFNKSQTRYIGYSEYSSVDYGVYYKGSDLFRDGAYHGKDYAYIAEEIETLVSKFRYELQFAEGTVDFKYSYRIDAKVIITDKTSAKPVYNYTETVVPEKIVEHTGKSVVISETVNLDYQKYNALAKKLSGYPGLESNLLVELHVNVVGESEDFSADSKNAFVTTISAPLCKQIIDTKLTSSIPQGENKVLAYNADAKSVHVWKILSIVLACCCAILAAEFVAFVLLTRNTDITYDLRLRRLVRSYKSFIQKINNVFDTTGYQLLFVDTFNEMLEIRDTIQSPVLMNENADRTCTRFLIPTNTKLLYVYELKVDDYDQIYNNPDPEEEPVIEIPAEPIAEAPAAPVMATVTEEIAPTVVEPAPVVEPEPVVESKPAVEPEPVIEPEPVVEPAPVATKTVRVIVKPTPKAEESTPAAPAEEESSVPMVYSRVRRSFESKLIQSEEDCKAYYSELKNALLAYKKVKSRLSWNCDTYNQGRNQLAKINIRGKTLCIYLALNPETYKDSKYFFTDMSEKSQYEATPMMLKIKSARGVKHAKELIAELAAKFELAENTAYEPIDYKPTYETTVALIERGLIRDPFGDVSASLAEASED